LRTRLRRNAATSIFFITFYIGLPTLGPELDARQEPPQKPQRLPRHDAAAIVKLVPVRVLDKAGRPVSGLTKEDFLIYDNRKSQTITEFEVHIIPGAEPTALAPPVTPESSRKYFILLDVQSNDPLGVKNSKQAAMHFIDSKFRPGDEAAVLYFAAMTGLNLVQYLTSDKAQVKKAIEKAGEHPPTAGGISGGEIGAAEGLALAEREERQRIAETGNQPDYQKPPDDAAARGMLPGNLFVGTENAIAVPGLAALGASQPQFLTSMSELAKAMQYIPGMKNILFFSGRGPGVSSAIAREFAAANAPVFVINSQNWIMKSVLSVSIKEKYAWDEHPLKEFALASGGQYFADVKDVQTISDRIQTLTGNYYVLGYYVDDKWDGMFHEIKVEVRRPGVQVCVQDGYYNPKPFAMLSEIEKRLHLFDLAFTSQPRIKDVAELAITPLFRSEPRAPNSLFLTKLSVGDKAGVPAEPAELFAFIFDHDRRPLLSRHWEMDLRPHAQKTLFPYFTWSLRPGEYECRLVVRGLETGQSARGTAFFRIPEPSSAAAAFDLLQPLLLVPGTEAQYVRMQDAPKTKEGSPSIISFFPVLPRQSAPLLGPLDPEAPRLMAVVPVQFLRDQAPEVELEVRLTMLPASEQMAVESGILDTKQTEGGLSFIVLEIRLPELSPGDYELEIAARDITTGAAHSVKTRLLKK
jgi:VWFA-related protein